MARLDGGADGRLDSVGIRLAWRLFQGSQLLGVPLSSPARSRVDGLCSSLGVPALPPLVDGLVAGATESSRISASQPHR